MYPQQYSQPSRLEQVLGKKRLSRVKTFWSIFWVGLKLMMPLQLLVLLALQVAMPDGMTPTSKLDGQSRWADLGMMPVLVFVFSLVVEPTTMWSFGKWRGVLTAGTICSVGVLLVFGAAHALIVLGLVFGLTFIVWLTWPWLKRAGKAFAKNEDVQDLVTMLWLLGAALTVVFLAIFSFRKHDPLYDSDS